MDQAPRHFVLARQSVRAQRCLGGTQGGTKRPCRPAKRFAGAPSKTLTPPLGSGRSPTVSSGLRLATGARLARSGTSLAGATFRLHPCSPMRNGPYPLFVRTRPTRPARRTILEQSRSRRPSCASNRQPFIPRHLNFSRACGCGSLLARAGCWAAGIAHMAHHCDKISSVIDTIRLTRPTRVPAPATHRIRRTCLDYHTRNHARKSKHRNIASPGSRLPPSTEL